MASALADYRIEKKFELNLIKMFDFYYKPPPYCGDSNFDIHVCKNVLQQGLQTISKLIQYPQVFNTQGS